MDELGHLEDLINEIRDSINMLYDMIRDAKHHGATYDELQQATGMARGTLQNIIAGENPKISF